MVLCEGHHSHHDALCLSSPLHACLDQPTLPLSPWRPDRVMPLWCRRLGTPLQAAKREMELVTFPIKCCTAQAAWQSQPAAGFAADLLHLQCLQSYLKHKERPEFPRQDVVLVCRLDFSTAMSQDSGSLMVACMGWSVCPLLFPFFRTIDLDLSDSKLILTQKDD